LEIALQFLSKQAGQGKKHLVLSSLHEEGNDKEKQWTALRELFRSHPIDQLWGVGRDFMMEHPDLGVPADYSESTEQLLQKIDPKQFRDQNILIKGRRDFAFERVVQLLEDKVHETVLEIDLNALEHNFRYFKNQLPHGTKVMSMV